MDERRLAYLEAMGVEVWTLRQDNFASSVGAFSEATHLEAAPEPLPTPEIAPIEPAVEASVAPEPADGAKRGASLPSAPELPPAAQTDANDVSGWQALQQQVAACRACDLHRERTQTVFGVGNPDADLLIIGEAPGADEDRQGEPFVGRAGQLLNAMLKAIGLQRQDVFIANILKCRPPGNRNPSVEEAAACQGFLQQQVAMIKPKLILSVGAVSAHNLLGGDEAVGRLRGKVHEYSEQKIPLLVTYHPAYLLRRPEEKAKAWDDLQRAAKLLG